MAFAWGLSSGYPKSHNHLKGRSGKWADEREDMMTTQSVLFWASHNLFTAAAICFGGATLVIMLYTYIHDHVLPAKSR
jgi:hypothetical protein